MGDGNNNSRGFQDMEPFRVELFSASFTIPWASMRSENNLLLAAFVVNRIQPRIEDALSRHFPRAVEQPDGGYLDIKLEEFFFPEVKFEEGSIKITFTGAVFIIWFAYQGVAAYPGFKEGAFEMYSDVRAAISAVQQQIKGSDAEEHEPIPQFFDTVEFWCRDPEDIERELLTNWKSRDPKMH
ncbi:hypothetical protein [Leisingera methylohalidivorans]|nr:hypothetical protein [Leisingera methylohalidivorans]